MPGLVGGLLIVDLIAVVTVGAVVVTLALGVVTFAVTADAVVLLQVDLFA